MIPSPSEISSFRPRRAFLGYERKETDEFLEHVAELLERAGKRIEDSEAELARHREKEQSLNEALLAVAKTADAIKRDARSEAETIRAGALELDQFVATTRSQLSAFLRETLETLVTTYGRAWTRVTDLSGKLAGGGERLCPSNPDIVAELHHAVQDELAVSLQDVLLRRTGIGTSRCQGLDCAEAIGRRMAQLLGWTPRRLQAELEAYGAHVARSHKFRE